LVELLKLREHVAERFIEAVVVTGVAGVVGGAATIAKGSSREQ
jgi:hypothetical protein